MNMVEGKKNLSKMNDAIKSRWMTKYNFIWLNVMVHKWETILYDIRSATIIIRSINWCETFIIIVDVYM